MSAARSLRLAFSALCFGAACQRTEPPPRPAEPSPEAEAKALVEQARREVENAPPPVAASSAPLYVPPAGPATLPLIVFLHGLGGSGDELRQGLHLEEMAAAFAFAFIAPDGVLDGSGRRFWNASESCCNFEQVEIDHVAALRRWIGEATGHPRVDAERVYLLGFSNGGFMAYRAACEIGGSLAGIVSIAGAGPGERAACRPERQLSVLQIHGDRDPIVKFEGGYLFADDRRPRYPSAEASVEYWAKFDGCSVPAVAGDALDLNPRLPGAETVVWSYPGCSRGRVELWKIAGGDHTAGLSRFSLKAILDFVAADRPAPPPR